ncbi:hypothetical protein [Fusobacterium sp.]|uniref:hypothetical protein n=1 Tax=Fusobacterium sp. TaxID=68766 RepID=UPI0029050C63|nr:hypothetical protein [Fusobacterium sp.]MDU1909708.1 hypothetical protein [Fusobacterium sp.]
MKLTEKINNIANILEIARNKYLSALEEIKKDIKYTSEGKEELESILLIQYAEDVKEANNKVASAIQEYIDSNNITGKSENLLNLNDVLILLKNLNTKLTDEELHSISQNFEEEFKTMNLLKREMELNGYSCDNYPKTFKKLNSKTEINETIKKLDMYKNNYFSNYINTPCIKYSLSELSALENEIGQLSVKYK